MYAPSEVLGTVIATQDQHGGVLYVADSKVMVYTEVQTDADGDATVSFRVRSTLVSGTDGSLLWADTSAMQTPATPSPAHSHAVVTTVFQQTGALARLQLWDVDAPYVHTLMTEVLVDAVVVDSVNTTIGVRKVHLDVGSGLYLNDRHVKVKGMCNHQDFAGVGVAVPDRINQYRVKQLKSLGANAW